MGVQQYSFHLILEKATKCEVDMRDVEIEDNIRFRNPNENVRPMVDYVPRWKNEYLIAPLVEDTKVEFAEKTPEELAFRVDVTGVWSDFIRINYIPDPVVRYSITRVHEDGRRELVIEGKHNSSWDVGYSLGRAFKLTRSCYKYEVELNLIHVEDPIKSTSREICIGPGSPSAELVKFWMFTGMLGLLLLFIFCAALRHEIRRIIHFGDLATLRSVPMKYSGERTTATPLVNTSITLSKPPKDQTKIVPLSYPATPQATVPPKPPK
ncbi:unnamed protein product [Nippostrongylus brasiliensis]|uniref:Uncharacterized protein n=1 Tax=Nippostrongylus brasiliensis TaxID=27835 RepID=A0A0N4Y1I9_NIPBR|nr:unnamed protein product [Nippostrongylus brasiliensis]